MATLENVGAILGFAIIAVVLLNLRKGIAPRNGKSPEYEDAWNASDNSHS